MDNSITYKNELYRKAIHLCSLTIPIAYIFTSHQKALQIIIPMTVVMLLADILSTRVSFVNKIVFGYLGALLREHEKENKRFVLNGASWVLISASLCILIFPKVVMIPAFTILIISDMLAALVGRKFGKNPLFDKSWEGTIAFIVSAIAVILCYGFAFAAPITFFAFGILGAVIGGFVEAGSKVLNIDDNLSIPLSIGLILWLGAFYAQSVNMPYLDLIK